MTVIVDGNRGEVILDPDAEALRRYNARADVQRARAQRLSAMRDTPSATIDSTPITWRPTSRCSRRSRPRVDLGAEAMGLFRTEFLYLERPICRARRSSTSTRSRR